MKLTIWLTQSQITSLAKGQKVSGDGCSVTETLDMTTQGWLPLHTVDLADSAFPNREQCVRGALAIIEEAEKLAMQHHMRTMRDLAEERDKVLAIGHDGPAQTTDDSNEDDIPF